MTANESARITNYKVTNKVIEFSLFKQKKKQTNITKTEIWRNRLCPISRHCRATQQIVIELGRF